MSRGSSSGMTSTACPRLSLLKLPRSRKPFCELSTIKQGNLSVCPRMSATMLARLVLTTRSERRLSGARKVGTAFAPVLVSQGLAILPESLLMRNFAGISLLTSKRQTIRSLSRLSQRMSWLLRRKITPNRGLALKKSGDAESFAGGNDRARICR